MVRRFVIGISGASGAPYAKRLCELLALMKDSEQLAPAIVLSRTAAEVWHHECGTSIFDQPFPVFEGRDYGAPFASGSADYQAMVVIPTSMSCLARIAQGISDDLLTRAADVILKERRKLILVPREMPVSTIHLENMLKLAKAGATIMPASPSFYGKPSSLPEALDTVVGRVLDHLGIANQLPVRWGEDVVMQRSTRTSKEPRPGSGRPSRPKWGSGSYPPVTPSGTWSSKAGARPSLPPTDRISVAPTTRTAIDPDETRPDTRHAVHRSSGPPFGRSPLNPNKSPYPPPFKK